MRISEDQRQFFVQAVGECLPGAEVYLFGSRTSDDQRGGDIDVLILGERKISLKEKLALKRKFYSRFGEQKLDILSMEREEESNFKDLVMEEAIKLN